jgi:hypothetical protein
LHPGRRHWAFASILLPSILSATAFRHSLTVLSGWLGWLIVRLADYFSHTTHSSRSLHHHYHHHHYGINLQLAIVRCAAQTSTTILISDFCPCRLKGIVSFFPLPLRMFSRPCASSTIKRLRNHFGTKTPTVQYSISLERLQASHSHETRPTVLHAINLFALGLSANFYRHDPLTRCATIFSLF